MFYMEVRNAAARKGFAEEARVAVGQAFAAAKARAVRLYLLAGTAKARLLAAFLTAQLSLVTVAGATDLESRINSMAGEIYRLIVQVSTAIAGVVVAYCLLCMLFSKDEKKVSSSMDWLKRAILCWICIFLVATIMRWIASNLALDRNVTLDGVFSGEDSSGSGQTE